MRIDIIHPKFKTDQHLVAEYREIKMSTAYYRRSARSKNGIDKSRISERYVLNSGHGYMWYDKFGFIVKRFELLLDEMKRRGFATNYTKIDFSGIPEEAFGDFVPNEEDLKVQMERIFEKIESKPLWWKYKRQKMNNFQEWKEFYMKNWDKLLNEYV